MPMSATRLWCILTLLTLRLLHYDSNYDLSNDPKCQQTLESGKVDDDFLSTAHSTFKTEQRNVRDPKYRPP